MARLSKEDLLKKASGLLDTSDEALSLLEDIQDTIEDTSDVTKLTEQVEELKKKVEEIPAFHTVGAFYKKIGGILSSAVPKTDTVKCFG